MTPLSKKPTISLAAVLTVLLASCLKIGCTDRLPSSPHPLKIVPQTATNSQMTPITIHGESFYPGIVVSYKDKSDSRLDIAFVAYLGDVKLYNVIYVDNTTITATVPEGISIGEYELTLVDPTGREGYLSNAFTVTDADRANHKEESESEEWLGSEVDTDPEHHPRAETDKEDPAYMDAGAADAGTSDSETGNQKSAAQTDTDTTGTIPAGTLDTGFGANGFVLDDTVFQTDALELFGDMTLDRQDNIIVTGIVSSPVTTARNVFLTRYLSDGKLDTKFGMGGINRYSKHETQNHPPRVFLDRNDKIILAGELLAKVDGIEGTTNAAAVLRYTPAGILDTGFGQSGVGLSRDKQFLVYNGLQDENDNTLLIGATRAEESATGIWNYSAFRFDPSGFPDTSFGRSGHITYDAASSGFGLSGVVDKDGYIYLSGDSGYTVRFTPSGFPDILFYIMGRTDAVILAYGMTTDHNDNFLMSGIGLSQSSDFDIRLLRFLPSGILDPDFGDNGIASFDLGGNEYTGFGVAVDDLGRILVAGYINNGSVPDALLIRFTDNGALDTDFAHGKGYLTISDSPLSQAGYAFMDVALDSKGGIIAGGVYRYNQINRLFLSRFYN